MAYDILGEDILGEDMMGEDLLGEDILGAQARRRGGMIRRAPSLFNKVPGVSGPALAKLPLGFGALICDVTNNTTGGQVVTRPQVPVVPRRLVVSIAGANSANYAVTINNVRVGTKSILASANGIDARAFAPNAFDVSLTAESAQPGIDITIDYTVTPAVSGTDVVAISSTFICDSVI